MTSTGADRRADTDQRVRLHGVRWAGYERLLEIRGESSVPRITYLQGELELLSPSSRHEVVARMIGRLLEAFAEERRIVLDAFGSTTWRRRKRERGGEADECYFLGPDRPSRPDLAIEVVVTSGGIEKLEVWRGLEVPEVWVWCDGRITVHVLRDRRYEVAARSALLPALDLELLARLVERRDQTRTIRLYRRLLRRG